MYKLIKGNGRLPIGSRKGKNMKTFYSVRYTGIGFYGARTAWFDNKEEAYKFAEQDYTDAPRRHSYRDPKKIADCERLIKYEKEFKEFEF